MTTNQVFSTNTNTLSFFDVSFNVLIKKRRKYPDGNYLIPYDIAKKGTDQSGTAVNSEDETRWLKNALMRI